ncbi:MAG: HopJ type III effector protein [Pseudomonadota bacterium]
MTPAELIRRLRAAPETLTFAGVLAVIDAHYHYTPTAFANGLGEDCVHNPAGVNEGSCRVLAFARRQRLDEAETLALFAEHHRKVLENPEGSDHANIRAFRRHGWRGVCFEGEPLTPKNPGRHD